MNDLENVCGMTFDLGEYTTAEEVEIAKHLYLASDLLKQSPEYQKKGLQRLYDETGIEPPGQIAARYLHLITKVVEAHQKNA